MYRVRINWDEADSQIGAFNAFENAVDLAKTRAGEGFKVFDENGTVVYDPLDDNEIPRMIENPSGKQKIRGISIISADHLIAFVLRNNPNALDIEEIAQTFINVGNFYQIRGDIAFCQSIIETGWFRFDKGTAVTPDQHNYSGLGVTSRGLRGAIFATVREGVKAQIQHLFAYATIEELPQGEILVDPRFHYVDRGSAPYWEDLSMKWSMDANYGKNILSLYEDLLQFAGTQQTEETVETDIPQAPPIDEPTENPPKPIELPSEDPQETVDQPVEDSPEPINQPKENPENDSPSPPTSSFGRIIRAIINFFKKIFS